jgi:hypothetical protein
MTPMTMKLILTLAVLMATPAVADPVLKFPNRWARWMAIAECSGSKVFECDYSSRTCIHGVRLGSRLVGEVLAEDRETILAHIECYDGGMCWSLDTGEATYHDGRRVPSLDIKTDYSQGEVEEMHSRCKSK